MAEKTGAGVGLAAGLDGRAFGIWHLHFLGGGVGFWQWHLGAAGVEALVTRTLALV